jgi:hypothetical protein
MFARKVCEKFHLLANKIKNRAAVPEGNGGAVENCRDEQRRRPVDFEMPLARVSSLLTKNQ